MFDIFKVHDPVARIPLVPLHTCFTTVLVPVSFRYSSGYRLVKIVQVGEGNSSRVRSH